MSEPRSTSALLAEVPRLAAGLEDQIDPVADVIEEAYSGDRQIFTIGNGGSASNASHFAQDLVKATVTDSLTRRIRATALTDNIAHLTALANDLAYAWIFEQQVRAFGRQGDVLIAFSGSGNSRNVTLAAGYAQHAGIRVVGFTGFDGGQLKTQADVNLHIPCTDMGVVESMHTLAFHLIVTELRERLRGPAAAPVQCPHCGASYMAGQITHRLDCVDRRLYPTVAEQEELRRVEAEIGNRKST